MLHAGPGKTGTTSIQATLAKKWSELLLRSKNYTNIGNNASILKSCKLAKCNSTLSSPPKGGQKFGLVQQIFSGFKRQDALRVDSCNEMQIKYEGCL